MLVKTILQVTEQSNQTNFTVIKNKTHKTNRDHLGQHLIQTNFKTAFTKKMSEMIYKMKTSKKKKKKKDKFFK